MRTSLARALGGQAAIAALSLMAFSMGCGGGGGGSGGSGTTTATGSGTDTGTGTTTGTGTAIACTGQPTDHVALSGTWVAHGELAVKMQGIPGGAITICPADQVNSASLLLMLTVEQDATDPTKLSKVQATLCSIELPVVTALVGTCDPSSSSLVSTQLVAPQKFLDALPKVVASAATGSLSAKEVGSTVNLGPIDVVVGATKGGAASPSWDTTKTSCDAPNVGRTASCETTCVTDCASLRDDDGDAFPGVSVDVCGYTPDDTKSKVKCNADTPNDPGATLQGKAFIDIEVNPTFNGTAASSCELKGTVDTQVLYHLVGADVWLAGAPITVTSAILSLPEFHVDPQQSKFRMVRIDGQYGAPNWNVDPTAPNAACTTLITRQNEL